MRKKSVVKSTIGYSPLIFGHQDKKGFPIKNKICKPEKTFKKSSNDDTAHRDFRINWRENKLQSQHAGFANKSRQKMTKIL